VLDERVVVAVVEMVSRWSSGICSHLIASCVLDESVVVGVQISTSILLVMVVGMVSRWSSRICSDLITSFARRLLLHIV
jgi:hypothetical protein